MRMIRRFQGPVHTPEQKLWLDRHTAPCGHSIALEHLDWLAAHKRMENDLDRMTVLKRDYADFLSRAPEYALALAVVWFIEESDSPWWPVFDDLKDKVEGFMVSAQETYAETNGFILAKERFGEAIARSWFAQTVLHERKLYGHSNFVCEWIKNNYLSRITDVADGVFCVKVQIQQKNEGETK